MCHGQPQTPRATVATSTEVTSMSARASNSPSPSSDGGGTSSHRTHRWREADSNRRSRFCERLCRRPIRDPDTASEATSGQVEMVNGSQGALPQPFRSGWDREFESVSLQRTVRVSRDIRLLRRKTGLFPRVCGAEQLARSGETGVARSYGSDRRQYLCRAKFQYRSVDEGNGLILMKRIGQRPSRARYADCARQASRVK
jgi:hypothetical protein